MCNEAVDDSLASLDFIPDWFVTSKMIKKLYSALCADDNIICFNEKSGNIVFSCNEVGVLSINLNKIYLDGNFDEDDADTIILIRLLVWHIRFEKWKVLKKDKRKINANSVAS